MQALLISHAEYEESRTHTILQNKNSVLYQTAQDDHKEHQQFFAEMDKKFNLIDLNLQCEEEINFQGYEIYLAMRKFFSDHLNHFDYEERILMPELQKLLTDNEIRAIDAISYRLMTPEQMVYMMEVLFPYMNHDDKLVFLLDIKEFEPEKFVLAWEEIASILTSDFRSVVRNSLHLEESFY